MCQCRVFRASEAVTQCMAEFAFLRGWLFTLQAVIEFRRRLVQGVEGSSLVAALLQVPHFDETTVKHCLRGRKAVKCFKSFVTQDSVERKGTLLMTPEQIVCLKKEKFCSVKFYKKLRVKCY